MKFKSTRGECNSLDFSEAIQQGLANDGGLFVPEQFPDLNWKQWDSSYDFPKVASEVLQPFMDNGNLSSDIDRICKAAFDFPLTIKRLNDDSSVFELFHGPTCAFKDVGARFLAECLTKTAPQDKETLILVATSGDTGGAVASAFHRKPGIRVAVLYPKGKVSPRQEKQLTCWGDNVQAFAVEGDFDACQSLVKEAFKDEAVHQRFQLTSANSINVGRLLPQAAYYAYASWRLWLEGGEKANFVIPSGNLGNACAAFYAKKMGFPIANIAMAVNANQSLLRYYRTSQWLPQNTIITLANAMDVGRPSNFERIQHLHPDLQELKSFSKVMSISDDEIKDCIARGEKVWGEIWCPHTATAVVMRERLSSGHWTIVSTAHPAKFESVVEPLIGHKLEVPRQLAALLSKPTQREVVTPDWPLILSHLNQS